jgi:hypothetical protein
MPRVSKHIWTLNKAQQRALAKVHERKYPIPEYTKAKAQWLRGYRAFRRLVRYDSLLNCAMVPWLGMVLGIEEDGSTHS